MSTRRFSGFHVFLFTLATVAVTVGLTVWIVRTYVYPAEFEPVALNATEQTRLESKLRALGVDPSFARSPSLARSDGEPGVGLGAGPLAPEPYSEDPSMREIGINERELNAMLAHNTNLANRLAIDLSDDLASARLLIPLDEDFPVFGGRILRVNAGIELAYRDQRPVVMLRGVSLMGVPIPNAWLGNLKNVDLVEQFGGQPGVWQAFADGIDSIEVRDGELKIKLRE